MRPLDNPLRRRLGSQLRVIRRRAGLSGQRLGERIGISQSKVSRVEAGDLWPPLADITRWLDACYVDQAERNRVIALAEAIEHGHTSVRDTGPGSLEVRAAELADLDATATLVREVAPLTVPSLLWTADYGRAWLDAANWRAELDVDAAVEAHLARGARLRAAELPVYDLMLTEAALRWRPAAAPDSLPAQRQAILDAARLKHITVRVIPDGTPTPPLMCGWALRGYPDGGMLVIVDTPAGQVTYADHAGVDPFTHLWQQLEAVALPPDASFDFIATLLNA